MKGAVALNCFVSFSIFMFVQGKLPVVVNTWPWPQAADAGIISRFSI